MGEVNIIFEDNHLLVVEKPVGMLSQKDKTGHDDISTVLKKYLKDKYKKPGNVYLGHVHRLDRMVGGIMVFAKTSKAASRLSEQMRDGKFQKKYLAVVEGRFKEQNGTYIHYLKKDKETNTVKVRSTCSSGFKRSVLDFHVLAGKKNMSLLLIDLKTGRSHQIRVQCREAGHPVAGDAKYGRKGKSTSIALWAYQLAFLHPTQKKSYSFSCKPPFVFPWNVFGEKPCI